MLRKRYAKWLSANQSTVRSSNINQKSRGVVKCCVFFPAKIYMNCFQVVTSKTSSSKMIRISSDVVIELGPTLLELLRTIVRESQRKRKGKRDEDVGEETESRWHDVLLQFPVLIDSFTSLLHIYSVSKQSRYSMLVNGLKSVVCLM